MTFVFAGTVSASTYWNLSGTHEVICTLGAGNYVHTYFDLVQDADGNLTGNGWYNPNHLYTETLTGEVYGDSITFDVLYTGVNAGYTVHAIGNIVPDGSISGEADSSTGQHFSWIMTPNALFDRYSEITSPDENEYVAGEVIFEAYLRDNDPDNIQWAVRKGTCAAGTNTVWGNVDGYNNLYSWTQDGYVQYFSSSVDTSGWDGGMYCFIFNPTENTGDTPIRLTREFYVADGYVHGGGQLIKTVGTKPKDNLKISFGGSIWDLGKAGYTGDWEVNFHNISNFPLFTYKKFHTTEILDLNLLDPYPGETSCYEAMNFVAKGQLDNGMDAWMIFRAGDYGAPGNWTEKSYDTVRISIYKEVVNDTGSGKKPIYDTLTDFGGSSTCVGTGRTNLDNGNITIWRD